MSEQKNEIPVWAQNLILSNQLLTARIDALTNLQKVAKQEKAQTQGEPVKQECSERVLAAQRHYDTLVAQMEQLKERKAKINEKDELSQHQSEYAANVEIWELEHKVEAARKAIPAAELDPNMLDKVTENMMFGIK